MTRILLALALALTSLPTLAAKEFYVVVPLRGKAAQLANIHVSLDSYTLPAAEIGVSYPGFDFGSVLHVSGDPSFKASTVSWSLKSAGVPAGMTLSLDGAGGAPVLGGTPTEATATNGKDFTIAASYKGKTGQQVYTIIVNGVALKVTEIVTSAPAELQYSFTCAITTAGGVKCWGDNRYGQLGNNSTTNSLAPVDAIGLTSGVAHIAAGFAHICAVTSTGKLMCWGHNDDAQLGVSLGDRLAPVEVPGVAAGTVSRIAAGYRNTCIITNKGGVKCWGNNTYGQIGNGATNNSVTLPIDVLGLSTGIARIAVGSDYACAVTSAGGAKCWGNNADGQLGTGGTSTSRVPVDVPSLTSGVVDISAGVHHTCAVTSTGVKCWGRNRNGQVGNNSTTDTLVPAAVSGLASGVASVAVGWNHTCALTTSGGVKCWGYNGLGQMGNNSTPDSLTPGDVVGLTSGAASLSVGFGHSCVRLAAGSAKCWGYNGYGQLGNHATGLSSMPVDVLR